LSRTEAEDSLRWWVVVEGPIARTPPRGAWLVSSADDGTTFLVRRWLWPGRFEKACVNTERALLEIIQSDPRDPERSPRKEMLTPGAAPERFAMAEVVRRTVCGQSKTSTFVKEPARGRWCINPVVDQSARWSAREPTRKRSPPRDRRESIGGVLVAPASVRPCDLSRYVCSGGESGERDLRIDAQFVAEWRLATEILVGSSPMRPRPTLAACAGTLVRGLVRPDQKRRSHQVARPRASNDCRSSADALSPAHSGPECNAQHDRVA
jgi:hypothetical protein